jgi:lipopolysaccharide/colanic/teichoic acid biosynthesis glycosyltransferase
MLAQLSRAAQIWRATLGLLQYRPPLAIHEAGRDGCGLLASLAGSAEEGRGRPLPRPSAAGWIEGSGGAGPALAGADLEQEPPRQARAPQVKVLLDPLLAAAALVFAAPLMLVIAVLVRLDSSGPALFRQMRYGLGGRPFVIYKFRTLYDGLGDHSGGSQTYGGDLRVTRVGRLLRKTSLDELPQLFNVLKGDMFLVGPRPHPIAMRIGVVTCAEIVPAYFARYRVKPGLTGWAQVHGLRGPIARPEQLRQRVAYDLHYIRHRSARLDLKIIGWTLLELWRAARRPTPSPVGAATAAGDARAAGPRPDQRRPASARGPLAFRGEPLE